MRVVAEGGVIALSILLALAGDAWWDERRDRAQEQELIADVRDELVESLSEMREVIEYHLDFARSRIDQLEVMNAEEIRALSPEEVDRYATSFWAFNNFDDRMGTLDGMVSSGRLQLLEDRRLRSLLGRWRGRLDDIEEEAALMVGAVEAVINREAELGVGVPYDPMTAEELVVLVGDAEFMALARAKRNFAVIYAMDLVVLERLAEEVIAGIDQSIGTDPSG
jgi:hypothetical protein